MANEPIKFTEEELTEIKDLQNATQEKISQFGQLKLERILTNQRLVQLEELEPKLENEYKQLQEKETQLVDTFKKKYGVGTLDLDNGVFIPSK